MRINLFLVAFVAAGLVVAHGKGLKGKIIIFLFLNENGSDEFTLNNIIEHMSTALVLLEI